MEFTPLTTRVTNRADVVEPSETRTLYFARPR